MHAQKILANLGDNNHIQDNNSLSQLLKCCSVATLQRWNVGTLQKSADFVDFDRFQYGIENESREWIFLENLQSN